MADPSKLVLIDGHALVYRAYFALPSTMATAQGELTNAVFGFASMLLNVLRDEQPDYLAVTFDIGRTFRHEAYAEYKANREEMPDDLRIQFERIYQLLATLDIPTYSAEGYEADDVLAALAQQAEEQGVDTLIVTGDEDEPCLEPDLFLKRTIPSAGLSVIPKSGHTINLEEPDIFNGIVQNFLATVETGRWGLRDSRSLKGSALLGNR